VMSKDSDNRRFAPESLPVCPSMKQVTYYYLLSKNMMDSLTGDLPCMGRLDTEVILLRLSAITTADIGQP
jgi:hypothetical protein